MNKGVINSCKLHISSIGIDSIALIISFLEFPLVLNQINFVNKLLYKAINTQLAWNNWEIRIDEHFPSIIPHRLQKLHLYITNSTENSYSKIGAKLNDYIAKINSNVSIGLKQLTLETWNRNYGNGANSFILYQESVTKFLSKISNTLVKLWIIWTDFPDQQLKPIVESLLFYNNYDHNNNKTDLIGENNILTYFHIAEIPECIIHYLPLFKQLNTLEINRGDNQLWDILPKLIKLQHLIVHNINLDQIKEIIDQVHQSKQQLIQFTSKDLDIYMVQLLIKLIPSLKYLSITRKVFSKLPGYLIIKLMGNKVEASDDYNYKYEPVLLTETSKKEILDYCYQHINIESDYNDTRNLNNSKYKINMEREPSYTKREYDSHHISSVITSIQTLKPNNKLACNNLDSSPMLLSFKIISAQFIQYDESTELICTFENGSTYKGNVLQLIDFYHENDIKPTILGIILAIELPLSQLHRSTNNNSNNFTSNSDNNNGSNVVVVNEPSSFNTANEICFNFGNPFITNAFSDTFIDNINTRDDNFNTDFNNNNTNNNNNNSGNNNYSSVSEFDDDDPGLKYCSDYKYISYSNSFHSDLRYNSNKYCIKSFLQLNKNIKLDNILQFSCNSEYIHPDIILHCPNIQYINYDIPGEYESYKLFNETINNPNIPTSIQCITLSQSHIIYNFDFVSRLINLKYLYLLNVCISTFKNLLSNGKYLYNLTDLACDLYESIDDSDYYNLLNNISDMKNLNNFVFEIGSSTYSVNLVELLKLNKLKQLMLLSNIEYKDTNEFMNELFKSANHNNLQYLCIYLPLPLRVLFFLRLGYSYYKFDLNQITIIQSDNKSTLSLSRAIQQFSSATLEKTKTDLFPEIIDPITGKPKAITSFYIFTRRLQSSIKLNQESIEILGEISKRLAIQFPEWNIHI